MSPREAGNRLFDRTMKESEQGDVERARFFAQMALQAYQQMSASEVVSDAHFHRGLLFLVLGDTIAARAEADGLLTERPSDLLGLVLAARTAQAAGDEVAERGFYERLRNALAAGESPSDSEYAAHAGLIEQEAKRSLQP